MVDWSPDAGDRESAEASQATGSGAAERARSKGQSDPAYGGGRVPTEFAFGIDAMAGVRVEEDALCFVTRRGPRKDAKQPKVDWPVLRTLGWILPTRRNVLEKHDRSSVSGSVVLLAPHY